MLADNSHYEAPGMLRRLRSALLLAGFVIVLGATAAAILALLIAGSASLIDHALG